MTSERTHLLHDALDLLVLKALEVEEMHGFGVCSQIEQVTKGAFEVSPQTLYTTLHKMETAGWLGSQWSEMNGRHPAKYYWLTSAGRHQLEIETRRSAHIPLADVVESVASQAGLEQDNSRLASSLALEAAERQRINQEMEVVHQVQRMLLPRDVPCLPGLECAGVCRPAFVVGGDCYDFLPLSNGRLGFAIGDVSGKGLASALLMASLQAFLRAATLDATDDLARLMTRLSKLLLGSTAADQYATFFYAQYDPANRKLIWVNAGHNPPLLFYDGEFRGLDDGGPVIGLLDDPKYEQSFTYLADGDLLLAYTDGVTETVNANCEEWGESRLRAAVKLHAIVNGRPLAAMLHDVLECAGVYAAGSPQRDDMTLVALRTVPLTRNPLCEETRNESPTVPV